MLGILVQLTISWLLLKYIQQQNLNALGMTRVARGLAQFAVGILFGGLVCLAHALIKSQLQGLHWQVNPDYSLTVFVEAIGFCFRSTFFEELLFRGALCYIGFKRIGAGPTMLISSAAFGIYHWFSFGIFGDAKMMIIIFVMTGLYGWTLAYGYWKTQSIMLGSGLHMGWLIVSLVVFSGGAIGNQWLIPASTPAQLSGTTQTVFFFSQLIGLPLVQYLLIRFLASRLHRG